MFVPAEILFRGVKSTLLCVVACVLAFPLVSCESEADRQAKEHKRIMKEITEREAKAFEENRKKQEEFDKEFWKK